MNEATPSGSGISGREAPIAAAEMPPSTGTSIVTTVSHASSMSTPPCGEKWIRSASRFEVKARKYSISWATNGSIRKWVSLPFVFPIVTPFPILSFIHPLTPSNGLSMQRRSFFPRFPNSWSGLATSRSVFSQGCSVGSPSRSVSGVTRTSLSPNRGGLPESSKSAFPTRRLASYSRIPFRAISLLYRLRMISSPNSEVLIKVAPSICRARS